MREKIIARLKEIREVCNSRLTKCSGCPKAIPCNVVTDSLIGYADDAAIESIADKMLAPLVALALGIEV
jgi:hypothetical protein